MSALAFHTSYKFTTLEHEKLSAIGVITQIEQSPKGFMWFAGRSGLARYDGYDVKLYLQDDLNQESVSTNSINDLMTDSKGALWVATYWGLNRYDGKRDAFTRYMHDAENPNSSSHNSVICIEEDKDGRIWFGTDGGGLNVFEPESGTFTHVENLPGISIRDLFFDSHDRLWVGFNGEGIGYFSLENGLDLAQFTHFTVENSGLSNGRVEDIVEDASGQIWVSSDWGINVFDANKQYFTPIIPERGKEGWLQAAVVWDMHVEQNGTFWLTDSESNLYTLDTKNIVFHRNTEAPPSEVKRFFSDSSGGLWLGLSPMGVARVDRYASSFQVINSTAEEGRNLTHDQIMSLAKDEEDNLWVGTVQGFNYLDRKNGLVTQYPPNTGGENFRLGSAAVSMIEDEQGLWIANSGYALARYNLDEANYRQYYADNSNVGAEKSDGLRDKELWQLGKGRDGTLWVGAHSGWLHRYLPESDSFKAINVWPEGNANRVMAIYEDSLEGLWVGTDNGLYHRAKGQPEAQFERYHQNGEHAIKPLNEAVIGIAEDSNGVMWFASAGGGAYSWDRKNDAFNTYSVDAGISHNSVFGAFEDRSGFIWFATAAGLSRFNPENKRFKNYNMQHGLPSNLFDRPSVQEFSNGEVAVGSSAGVLIFDPLKVYENATPPKVVISDIKLFNKSLSAREQTPESDTPLLDSNISYTDEVVFNHRQTVFSLEFTALNFDVSDENRYAYKLDGFDRDWVDSGIKREATYTNLDAGTYMFRVKGSNNEGVWSESEAQLLIRVLPPWWETIWAYSLYTVAAMLFVAYLISGQYRKRKRAELYSAELEAKVQERTSELEGAYVKLKEQSLTDQLTGLRNRHFIFKSLSEDLAQVRRTYGVHAQTENGTANTSDFVVYLIDLDHFKSVNDNYGHNAGDLVLREIAGILNRVCRESDIVARWGGEEFMIISRYTDRDQANILAERIRIAVEQYRFTLDNGEQLQRTCSIGFASFPLDPSRPEALNFEQTVDIADWSLYQVKKQKRNGWAGMIGCDSNIAKIEDVVLNTYLLVKEEKLHYIHSF